MIDRTATSLLAFRHLRSRRAEGAISVIGWFSLIGILLGVAALIVVLSVMNGFREKLLDRMLGMNGHIVIYTNPRGPIDDLDRLVDRLRQVDGVVSATPMIELQVLAAGARRATGALVRAMRPGDFIGRGDVASKVRHGTLRDFNGPRTVFIGSVMANRLGLWLDQEIRLTAAPEDPTSLRRPPPRRAFTIGGIFHTGLSEFDGNLIYMPLEAAQRLLRTEEEGNAVEVMLADPMAICNPDADRDDCPVRQAVAGTSVQPISLVDWKEANASFFGAIQMERNAMFLILGLIVLVAAFNIVSSMVMLVKEKTADIAMLRTMGASRTMILRTFLLIGSTIGVVGTSAGLALGLAVAENVGAILRTLTALLGGSGATRDFLGRMEGLIDPGEVAAIAVMSLVLTVGATIYPAVRAARIDPVEGLRHG